MLHSISSLREITLQVSSFLSHLILNSIPPQTNEDLNAFMDLQETKFDQGVAWVTALEVENWTLNLLSASSNPAFVSELCALLLSVRILSGPN